MFDYGFKKGKQLSGHGSGEDIVIYIPHQIVIYIEQNENIPDELKLLLIFPGGEEYRYHIPVMKYWKYNTEDLVKRKLYPLIALQVFKLRYKLEGIKRRKGGTEEQLKKVILEAKEVVMEVGAESRRLQQEGLITADDLHSILRATNSLFTYLNNRYTNIEQLNKEVQTMIKSFYDPAVEERGIEKGREEMKATIHSFLSGLNDYTAYQNHLTNQLDEVKNLSQLRELILVSAGVKNVEEFMQLLA